MQTHRQSVVDRFLTDGRRNAEHSWSSLGKTANKLLKVARSRRRETQAQIEDWIARARSTELIERARDTQRGWEKAANRWSGALGAQMVSLHVGVLNACGLASHRQVEALAGDVSKIARKVGRLSKAAPPNHERTHANGAA